MQRSILLLALVVLTLLVGCSRKPVAPTIHCSKPQQAGANSGVPSGCFDFYVLAETWNPQFCTHRKDYPCKNLKNTWADTNLGPHGLWPQYANFQGNPKVVAYPVKCINSPDGSHFVLSKLPEALQKNYKKVVPIAPLTLAKHEWEKHGTCSHLTEQAYFTQIINYVTNKLPTPAAFKMNIGKAVSYQQLANWYNGAKWVQLQCYYETKENKQYLTQIMTFWSKSGKRIENPGLSSSCKANMPIYIRAV